MHDAAHRVRSMNNALEAKTRSFEKADQALIDKVRYLDLELRAVSLGLQNKFEETEKLRAQMSRFVECLPIGAILVHQDGKILNVNQAVTTLLGSEHPLREGQMLKQGWRKLHLPPAPFSQYSYQGKRLNCWEEILGEPGTFPCLTVRFMNAESGEGKRQQDDHDPRGSNMEEVIAKIAHDLRNALTSIELFSSLVEKRPCNDSQHQSLGTYLIKSVRSLNKIVNSMLAFSSPQEIRPETVNLSSLFDHVEILLTQPLQTHQVILRRTVATDAEYLEGDSTLLQRACLNVLLNAISASPPGGIIEVECYRMKNPKPASQNEGEAVCIQVHDVGCGINADDLPHVCEPRYTGRNGGTGLGLSIAKDVMQAHHGTIDIRSREGQGTTVSLSFPQQRRWE